MHFSFWIRLIFSRKLIKLFWFNLILDIKVIINQLIIELGFTIQQVLKVLICKFKEKISHFPWWNMSYFIFRFWLKMYFNNAKKLCFFPHFSCIIFVFQIFATFWCKKFDGLKYIILTWYLIWYWSLHAKIFQKGRRDTPPPPPFLYLILWTFAFIFNDGFVGDQEYGWGTSKKDIW